VLSRIFEPFFSTRLTGRGLGLPAALGIVRGHRGAIAVESTPGVGTAITIWLPVSERR
jgi:two-component system, cell cycle sensor histidine kinase and response regulator CckA